MKGYCMIVMCLLCTSLVYPRSNSKIDSLKDELKHTKNKAAVLNELARIYFNDSPIDAFHYATQASEEALRNNNKRELGNAMWSIARYYLFISDYTRSNLYVDSARNLYHETKQRKNAINCLVFKANTLSLQGDLDGSLELYRISAKESKIIGAEDLYCSIIMNSGRVYRSLGEYDTALVCFEKTLAIAKEINHKYLEGHAYMFLGIVYLDQHKNDPGIDNLMKALQIFEQENIAIQIPYVLTSLGNAYMDNNNSQESLRYFRKARNYYIKSNDRWGLEELYRYIGGVYLEINELDSAWIYNEKALKLSREIKEKTGEIMALNNLGEIMIKRGKYYEALEYLNEALKLERDVKSTLNQVIILLNIGRCYVSMGTVNKGLEVLLRSLELAESSNLETQRMVLHKEISSAYSKTGSYKKALLHYEAYATLNDSLFREESSRHFIEMEQKYQSEQREKEISQLKLDKMEKDVTIRYQRSARNIFLFGFLFSLIVGVLLFRSNRIRRKSNDEKEALLKEIHHRVKNNLQIISSLLKIQTQNVTDISVITAVKESQSRVKAMALIHQLLYQEKELTRIDFKTYLPQLIHAVSSIFKKEGEEVDVDIEASDISFDIDTSIPLGLIITELVSNAFKHAFDGMKKGTIKVVLNPVENEKYLLTVADNGKGLPEGTRILEFNTMGLRLVKMLTGQLNGTLDYYYSKGAVFTIKFADTL